MKRYIHITVFILLSFNSFAQFKTQRFGTFNSRNGLSSDYINDQVIDHSGYLWLATWDGLCRFDGKRWKVYKHIDGDSTSIPSSGINTLFVDLYGKIWIGTDVGICIYNPMYDNFTTPKHIFPNRQNQERTYSISALPQNHTLLICSTNGLYLYNLNNHRFSLLHPSPEHAVNKISAVCFFSENDSYYLGTVGKGLWLYDKTTQRMQHLNNERNAFFDKETLQILSFVKRDARSLYIATSAGLVVFDYKEKKIVSVIDEHSTVNSLFIDKNKNLWVSKINEPLKVFDLKSNTEEVLSFFYANNQKIRYNSATRITEDNLGNLWIGTHGNGVFYLDKYYNKIVQYSTNTPFQLGLQGDIVSCFFEQTNGKMWIGTDGGGLHLFNRANNTFTQYNLFNSNAILDIKPASGNTLWIATYGGGLSLFDPDNKTAKIYLRNNDRYSIPCNEIKCILPINDTTIYLAFVGFGLGIFNPQTEMCKTILNDSLLYRTFESNRWCNYILYDSKKNLWIASSYGILLKTPQTLTKFLTTDSSNTISDNIVNFVYEDSQKRIFVGTNGGLDLWNEKTKGFIRLKTMLPISGIFKSVVEDVHGDLWFGTNSGIVKINRTLTNVQSFTECDGLQGNQFFPRAAYRSKDNLLYFGGLTGFNIIDPKILLRYIPQTPIVFTDFQVLNKSQLPLKAESVLSKDINYTDTVTLTYDLSMLSFEFVNLDILGMGKIQYKYRLKNFNNQWFIADQSNKITYTNLDPGFYTLQIQSSNRFGSWQNPATKQLTIHILTPWWMTWWFRILVAVLLVSLVVFELNRYRKQNSILAIMVHERTKELEVNNKELVIQNTITSQQREELLAKNQEIEAQKNYIETQNKDLQISNERLTQSLRTKDKFMSIIGHDLKNPISAIIGISDLACSSFEKYSDAKKLMFLKTINSSALTVFELLESLLLWARTQTGSVEYKPEKFKIVEVIQFVQELLRDSAIKKQIDLSSSVDEHCEVYADKNMLNTIIRNLTSNAIKFTPREGTVTITVQKTTESKICIRIADTGQGMTSEQIASLFQIGKTKSTAGTENETGTGLGLILCYEFLKMHNSALHVESQLEKGTTFSFEL